LAVFLTWPLSLVGFGTVSFTMLAASRSRRAWIGKIALFPMLRPSIRALLAPGLIRLRASDSPK